MNPGVVAAHFKALTFVWGDMLSRRNLLKCLVTLDQDLLNCLLNRQYQLELTVTTLTFRLFMRAIDLHFSMPSL